MVREAAPCFSGSSTDARGCRTTDVRVCPSVAFRTGPEFAGTCTQAFLPPDARFATVEFLPNMIGSAGSRFAFDELLRTLASRRVRTVVVEVIPDWVRLAEPEMLTHRANVAAASLHGFAVVNVSMAVAAHSTYFSRNHLSAEGNVFVADAVRRHFAAPQPAPVDAMAAANMVGVGGAQQVQVECAFGAAVRARALVADGFREVDIDNGRSREHPKLAMEGRRAGACLELCAFSSVSARVHTGGALFIGFQHSHKLNVPVVGVSHAWCEGACMCAPALAKARDIICSAERPCVWETLHARMVTVTVFQQLQLQMVRTSPASEHASNGTACACRLHVRVAPTADGRSRVLVRALVIAPDALTAAGAARGLSAFGKRAAELRRSRLLLSDEPGHDRARPTLLE